MCDTSGFILPHPQRKKQVTERSAAAAPMLNSPPLFSGVVEQKGRKFFRPYINNKYRHQIFF